MTLAILSWGAHRTLINSLESIKRYELDLTDSERIIYFQEISDLDIRIARAYGYQWMGTDTNIGIGPAYAELIRRATGEFFLFLENDWECIAPIEPQINDAKALLSLDIIDVAKFRHRTKPGAPLWSAQFAGNEYSRPQYLLDSIHWTDPERFEEIGRMGKWYITDAKYANWTNNPTMFRTEWLREYMLPWMSGDVERGIEEWWPKQPFKVGQSEGLFTHNRIG